MNICAIAERETGVVVEDADSSQVRATLDRRARDELGISGDDFLSALHEGKFDQEDTPALGRLRAIASLLA